MIIECQECHARFRLDETRIKGKGARVRCRRCGESILVMKEEGAGPIDEPLSSTPPAGQFDNNLAVEGALDAGAGEPPPEGIDLPASSGMFDINQAVEDALEAAPAAASPAPPAFEEFVDLGAQARVEPAPPVYESGIDPFATVQDDAPVLPELSATPVLLTETPFELAAVETAPPSPTPELDDVDLAFEQFLAGGDDELAAAAPPPPSQEEPGVPLPTADDGLFDLSTAELPLPGEDAVPGIAESAPFLLNDNDTLELLGNRYKDEAAGTAAGAVPKEEPFSFQLDEESMAVPERAGESPFMHNAAEEAAASDAGAFPAEPGPEAQPPRQPPLPQEIPVPKSVLRGTRPQEPRGPFIRPGAALFGVLFLALAGAVGYLGFSGGGRAFLRSTIPSLGPLLGESQGSQKAGAQFDIRNLIGYYDNTSKAGRMFVIKGQVANTGKTTRGSIRIHAALLDNTNRSLAEKTVYAGNVLGGEALRVADKESIEKTLSSPFGEGLANMDIAPGKSVPFMVVFLDIPEGIDAYRLEAKEGE
jgi:predicted Zn finger-like uncharacterized protein